jgi:hypothetical protein
VGSNVSSSSGPAGCARTAVPVSPYFNETSGTGGFAVSANISTSCSGWRSGSSFGPNSSSAEVAVSLSVNRSLNVSSILGPNVTTGNVYLTEDWRLSVGASEKFYHRTGSCAQPYWSTYFYGCEGWSSYDWLMESFVWDNTSHAIVSGSASSWGTAADKIYCTYSGSYCSEHGGNQSINQTKTVKLQFSGKLNSTHQYFLVTWFTAQLSVYLSGWRGAGSARVNLATRGHGADLTGVDIW